MVRHATRCCTASQSESPKTLIVDLKRAPLSLSANGCVLFAMNGFRYSQQTVCIIPKLGSLVSFLCNNTKQFVNDARSYST